MSVHRATVVATPGGCKVASQGYFPKPLEEPHPLFSPREYIKPGATPGGSAGGSAFFLLLFSSKSCVKMAQFNRVSVFNERFCRVKNELSWRSKFDKLFFSGDAQYILYDFVVIFISFSQHMTPTNS